jgi:hypothetical protein
MDTSSLPYMRLEVSSYNSPWQKATNTGLGNVFFQIATTYALCKKYGFRPDFTNIHEFGKKLRDRFGLDHDEKLFSRLPAGPTEPINYTVKLDGGGGGKDGYRPDFINYIKMLKKYNQNIRIEGYLEDDTYFYEYADEIRQMLAAPPEYKEKLAALVPTGRVPVSLHVRGHEFITHTFAEHNGPDPTIFQKEFVGKYLTKAIDYIADHVPGAYFLIFTDDPKAINVSSLPRLVECGYRFVEGFRDYEDIWLMSLCSHNITGLSTFSWWGTWLAGNDGRIRTFDFLNVRQRHMKSGFIAF